MKILKLFAFLLCFLIISACQSTRLDRFKKVEKPARTAGFEAHLVSTDDFNIMTWSRFSDPVQKLIIYIEGDGLAWKSRTQVSDDPTPINPLAFKLTQSDPRANIIYIARPCQFTISQGFGQNCHRKYWSSHRFSETVVKSMDEAISYWKGKTGAGSIELVGFSGGAAIAVLLADRRNDISLIRTVAGNLDHQRLHTHHKVTQLSGSLNPQNVDLEKVPHIHYIGGKDEIIPPFIAQGFVEGQSCTSCGKTITLKKATHHQGWVENWPALLERPSEFR